MYNRKKSGFLYLIFTTTLVLWFIITFNCCNLQRENNEAENVHEILGREESCMQCHSDYTGFAPSHNPEIIGCSPCHGGQPREANENEAHAGMWLVPGNLSNVYQTCGTLNCHGDIAHRVENSLMASMAGVVTVNRFAFGEIDSLSAYAHIRDLGLEKPADVHLRQLCASCHLGNEKTEPAPVHEMSRGGGCIACHLDYTPPNHTTPANKIHPAINLKVTNNHCFGCHSRSGRISTNYEGWHETTLDAETYVGKPGYRLLEDGRIFEKISPDLHHDLGLECIDCHSAKELMGDGKIYLHEEDAVKVRCEDCHFSEIPKTATYPELDIEAKKLLQLRQAEYLNQKFVIGKESGEAFVNVIIDSTGQAIMVSKNSGKRFPLSPAAEICSRGNVHDALSCNACHTEWAPQCVGCHNTFEQEERAFDLLDKQKVQGKWIEHLGEFFAEKPSLGIVEDHKLRQIKTFIPGMIMTIDKSGFPGEETSPEVFHRLFAPSAPHTTNREGRSCQSCHNNPLAIGYGRGVLNYEILGNTGRWRFISDYENSPQDGLPQDAWIGFLQFPEGASSTRPNARPFTVLEQQKILTVGACLTCHQGNSEIMLQSLEDFDRVLNAVSKDCILPVWE